MTWSIPENMIEEDIESLLVAFLPKTSVRRSMLELVFESCLLCVCDKCCNSISWYTSNAKIAESYEEG